MSTLTSSAFVRSIWSISKDIDVSANINSINLFINLEHEDVIMALCCLIALSVIGISAIFVGYCFRFLFPRRTSRFDFDAETAPLTPNSRSQSSHNKSSRQSATRHVRLAPDKDISRFQRAQSVPVEILHSS